MVKDMVANRWGRRSEAIDALISDFVDLSTTIHHFRIDCNSLRYENNKLGKANKTATVRIIKCQLNREYSSPSLWLKFYYQQVELYFNDSTSLQITNPLQ